MSVSFQRQMELIVAKAGRRGKELAHRIEQHCGDSIKFGSVVTGAPGQPVETGHLLDSWHLQRIAPYLGRWISTVEYASVIEDNFRGAQLRSHWGGFHSVKMTRHGFKQIVDYELALIPNFPLRFR
jgi:hypothetical protein